MIVYRALSTLEKDLGVRAGTLYALSNNLSAHYHCVELPKPGGGVRRLTVPDAPLKAVQRAIARTLLPLSPVADCATAYRDGGRLVYNALPHVRRPLLLKLDIRHFFDSILYYQVKELVFPPEVYAEPLRVLLTMLCYYRDALPQGAPTSPAISNIILHSFDDEMSIWCRERDITYTRYCDDLSFSGSFDPSEVRRHAARELSKMGFYLNDAKTQLLRPGQRQCVTGIVVNRQPGVPVEYRRALRQELYYCRRFGVAEHLHRRGLDCPSRSYLLRLLGRVSHVLSVTPQSAEMRTYRLWLLEQLKNEQ